MDICIADIQMPDLDGLTFIERAKALRQGKRTQFILLSGYAEFSYAERAISLGVSDYLLKPLANEALARAMKKAMGLLEEEARRQALASSRERLARTQQDFWLEREINALLNEKKPLENRKRYPQLQERHPELLNAGDQVLMLGILNIEADSYSQGSFEREDAELLRFSVRNVFSELGSRGAKLIADNLTNMEQMYLIFLGRDPMSLREEVERIFVRIYTLFEKKLDVSVHGSQRLQERAGCRSQKRGRGSFEMAGYPGQDGIVLLWGPEDAGGEELSHGRAESPGSLHGERRLRGHAQIH